MGAYKFDPVNPPVMEGGKRNPLKQDDGTCKCAAVHLAPRLLRPLVRRLLMPDRVPVITEKDLHPNVERAVTALLGLQDHTAVSRAANGARVRIGFTKPQRNSADFHTDLSILLDQEEVFAGSLDISGVWHRGKVAFAHAVIGAVELLYLHLPEMALRDEAEVNLRIGVIAVVGKATNLPLINGMTSDEVSTAVALQKQNNGGGGGGPTCAPNGPFDPHALFGAFPSTGYGYFHGPNGELLDQRIE